MATDHALRMSRSNSNAFVATCACGWVGTPQRVPADRDKAGKIKRYPAMAERAAVADFNSHAYALQPSSVLREYKCEGCRKSITAPPGTHTCPSCAGSLTLRGQRA